MPTNPYSALLRTPGAARFSAAAALARAPMAMVGIGIVLMVQMLTGSFAAAGRVSAVFMVAQAVSAPIIARRVDRLGQRRVGLPMMFIQIIGFLGIVTAAEFHAPEPLLWLSAAIIGGASGGYGAYVRARWSYVLKDGPKLHTAFSLEGAIDEGIFVVGPIIATLLATGIEPASGVVFAALVGLAGGLWFLSQRETEPPIVAKTLASDTAAATTSVTSPPAILVPGVPFIAGTFVAMGAVFGSVDVSTVAFAKAAGHSSMAGLFLAFIAFGSMSAGLAYGAKHWRSRLSSRFAVGTLMLAAMVTLLLTVHSVIVLPFVMVLTGIAIAPTIINGNAMVQALVPLDRLTEGLAWIGTSLNVGASLGSWLAGMRIDAVGAHGGFFVAMIAGWVMVLLALIALPVLRKQPGRQPAEPVHDGDA